MIYYDKPKFKKRGDFMHARTKVTVRYAETDRMGIVHHSNYPIWYEIARNDYIKMFGISYTDMEMQV